MSQLWHTNSLGGFMYADELSDYLRCAVQPLVKFRQFCDAQDATNKGVGKGDLWHWDVYADVATQGGTLVETTTMPETNFTITQGTLTVTEYGNSVPYTGKLDNLSKHPVTKVINKALKNDAKKAFDNAAHTQFAASTVTVSPTAGTATDAITVLETGTATDTVSVEMNKSHVKLISDQMKERNIPPYLMDDYFCIARPSTYRTFKNELEGVYQHTPEGFRMIFNGEIGRYEGFRFIEQTHIASDGWSASDRAYFFGEDTVAEAVAIPEEMRGKIPSDYGRSKGIAWYYLGGFGIVHDVAAQTRILRWESAQ